MRSYNTANTARKFGPSPRLRGHRPARPRRRVVRQDQGGTGILVMGVLGVLLCGALGIVAWVQGVSYEKSCRARGVIPSSAGNIGKILGMVATCLWGLWMLLSFTGRFGHFSFLPFF